jgi:hypothetical protein
MSTKQENIVDPKSCWNRAGLDEPVFVLRANDPSAPDTIIMWANRYRMRGGRLEKFHEAIAAAQAMRDWYNKHVIEDDIPF